MLYTIIILTILFVVIVLWKRGKKPYKHIGVSQDDLKRFLETLLFRGYDNGVMYVQMPNKIKLEFSKYVNEKNLASIQFSFPLAEWSKSYYDRFKAVLIENDVKFKVRKIQKEEALELLLVDFKQDIEFGQKLARLVFRDLFGLKDGDNVDIYFENVSARDEKIGD